MFESKWLGNIRAARHLQWGSSLLKRSCSWLWLTWVGICSVLYPDTTLHQLCETWNKSVKFQPLPTQRFSCFYATFAWLSWVYKLRGRFHSQSHTNVAAKPVHLVQPHTCVSSTHELHHFSYENRTDYWLFFCWIELFATWLQISMWDKDLSRMNYSLLLELTSLHRAICQNKRLLLRGKLRQVWILSSLEMGAHFQCSGR